MKDTKPHVCLDASGLARPLAAVRVRQALDAMSSGQVILVQSVPPGMPEDMEYFAERVGHEILRVEEEGDGTDLYIRKG